MPTKTKTKTNFIMKITYLITIFLILTSCNLKKEKKEQSQSKETKNEHFESYQVKSYSIPENLEFAGEKVPTDRFDIKESLDREILVNTYWHSHTIMLIKKANKWFPVIEKILKENGIHDDFKYMAVIESELSNAVSPAGATGFWQFMKPTANDYNLEVSKTIDERYDVEKSTVAACKYLKHAHKIFSNWTLAAASYNMGMGGLKKRLKQQNVDSYYDLQLNSETSRYVYRMLAMKLILSNPKKYGFNIEKKHLYTQPKVNIVDIDSSINDLVRFAEDQGTNYKLLKALNPWLRENKLENNSKNSYKIKIYKVNK